MMSKRDDKRKKKKDNVVYLKGSEEAGEENKRRQNMQNKKRSIIFLFCIVLAVVCGVIAYKLLNRRYVGYKVLESNSTAYENTANYIKYNGNLLKYTPDGVSYINSNGDTVWSAGINMNMPVAKTSGKYAVVADMNGNSVCVFNDSGQVSSLTMPYAICDVDVGKQGAFAVVLESKETNYINLYDKTGAQIYEMKTTINKSGYPIDITISDNAEKLITSYINITGTAVQNNVVAYNFGDVGQNSNVDRMVGGYLFDDEVVTKVEFVDNNTVVAFGTKTINVYQMKEKPNKKSSVKLSDEANSVFCSDKFFGYVVKNDNNEHPYELRLYSMSGKLKFTHYIDFEYDNIYAASKEVIVTGGDDCLIMRSNGSCKYDGKLSGKIQSMVPSGNNLEYVVVYDDSTEIIKLKTKVQTNSDESDSNTEEDINKVTTAENISDINEDTTESNPADEPDNDFDDKINSDTDS